MKNGLQQSLNTLRGYMKKILLPLISSMLQAESALHELEMRAFHNKTRSKQKKKADPDKKSKRKMAKASKRRNR